MNFGVVLNDGLTELSERGYADHDMIHAAGGWNNALNVADLSHTDWWKPWPTPSSLMDKGIPIISHMPWGRIEPMTIEALTLNTAKLGNRVVGTSCDAREFVYAASEARARGAKFSVYSGGLGNVQALPQEAPHEMVERLRPNFQPYKDVFPRLTRVFWDSTPGFKRTWRHGSSWHLLGGPNGAEHLLLQEFDRAEIPQSIEPARLVDACWLPDVGSYMNSVPFYENHKDNWVMNDPFGNKVAIVLPYAMPSCHIRVVMKREWSDEQRIDAVKMYADFGLTPVVNLPDYRPGMEE